MKLLYLTTMGIVDKWMMSIRDWGTILDQLIISLTTELNFSFKFYPQNSWLWTLHKILHALLFSFKKQTGDTFLYRLFVLNIIAS